MKLCRAKFIEDPLSVKAEASAASFTLGVAEYESDPVVQFKYQVRQTGDENILWHGTEGVITSLSPEWLVYAFCLREFFDGHDEFSKKCREFAEHFDEHSNWFLGEFDDVSFDKLGYVRCFGHDKCINADLLFRYGVQKHFFRIGRFLNIPGPGIGHDGDPNISIELSDEIQGPVSEFLRRFLELGQKA